MSEQISNVNAQLRTWEDQHTLDIVEIDRLKADIAVIELEIAALRAFEGDRGKIHADCKQLKKVFNAHLKYAGSSKEPSAYLLAFYAVEYGLKYVYLRSCKMQSTQQLANSGLLEHNGHDLAKWCKDIKMPASLLSTTLHFRLLIYKSKQYNISKAHEAWRYGIPIEEDHQTKIVQWLSDVSLWIRQRMETI